MTSRQFRLFALVVGTIAWLGAGGEALTRFEGDWWLDTLTLTRNDRIKAVAAEPGDGERGLLAQTTYQKGVDPEWFFLPPAPLAMPRNAELKARSDANPADGKGWRILFGTMPRWRTLRPTLLTWLGNRRSGLSSRFKASTAHLIHTIASTRATDRIPDDKSLGLAWDRHGSAQATANHPRGYAWRFHDAQSLYVKSAELSQCVGHSK